jgi:hypothetical protein
MSVTVSDPALLAPPPEDVDGRTMVTPEVEGTVVAGTTFPIIARHA